MDSYVELAYQSIRSKLTQEPISNASLLPPEMVQNKAGVFVSLHKKNDQSLRGCIGTFLPTKSNIAQEVIANAQSAAFADPRFLPVTMEELDNLQIHVDVLSEPESIDSIKNIDPQTYGMLVKNKQGRSGLLLPDIGVGTAAEQFSICCQKGGINPKTDQVELYRFTVNRHT